MIAIHTTVRLVSSTAATRSSLRIGEGKGICCTAGRVVVGEYGGTGTTVFMPARSASRPALVR